MNKTPHANWFGDSREGKAARETLEEKAIILISADEGEEEEDKRIEAKMVINGDLIRIRKLVAIYTVEVAGQFGAVKSHVGANVAA